MVRPRSILIAAMAIGIASVALAPAKAEFFGCNTPRVTHSTTYNGGGSYRAGSRYTQHSYSQAPRRYYGYSRTSHYSARNYRSQW